MTVGRRLLRIRKSTGLTQANFGKLFDLSDRAYKNYELDIRLVSSHLVLGLCEQYNISADWLLLGRGLPRTAGRRCKGDAEMPASEPKKRRAGRRLREIRLIAGQTQQAFADEIGASARAYAAYELNERSMPLPVLCAVCKVHSVSSDWLLFGTGGRDALDVGEQVEEATLAVLEYLEQHKIEVPAAKAARLVRHLFDHQQSTEEDMPAYRDSFMRSAI